MKECLFCQIVAGKSPCYKVYENEKFFGFLDINPATEGHTLIIPKKHYLWVYDVPEFGSYWEAVLKITRAIQRALKPEFVTYLTYGLQVPHAHIHILPRGEKDSHEIVPKQKQTDKEEMKKIAAQIYQEVRQI